jgi:hypothetical protein
MLDTGIKERRDRERKKMREKRDGDIVYIKN